MSAMVIEESRLRMMSNNNPVKLAYTIVAERKCYNCGEEGHLSYNCPLPKNNGGRSGAHGGARGDQGGGCGGHGGDCTGVVAEAMVALKPMLLPWRVVPKSMLLP